ncbi:MAG: insulinase family protein [Spirochaetia bacterium]|nr:insulinase family protein [Spirochaetia bacterium]
MNRLVRGLVAFALISILSLVSCMGLPEKVNLDNATILPGASSYSSDAPLPLAPELTKKVLPNGLTYYVRRNSNPGGRAVMFLIVNSGSTNERPDQSGYAHFVEHMAFNGTSSFPENELVNYLRSIGMDFGAEINAHTTREETLYTLQMPLNDPSFFDTGLKVLKEWATAVSFDPVEVEKEKGVILEEMRLSLGPDESARVREVNGLLAGTAHADREPIGTAESVRNATAASLKEFYDEHYRPDRMAVIVVGDIDPRSVAARIEEQFSFPSKDGLVKPRPGFAVSPTTDMGFVSTFDPNINRSILSYRKIVPYEPEILIGDYEALLRIRLAAESIRMRLNDLTRTGQAAWREAYFDDDYFFGRTRLYSFTLEAAEGQELVAFAGLSAEVERLRRHGFTDSEFHRTVDIYRRWLGTLDVEDDDLRSFSFAEEYVRNFMYGEPVPGVVYERVYIKKVLDTLTLDVLNEAGRKILGADEGFVALRAKAGAGTEALTESAFELVLRDARKAVLDPLEASGDDVGLFDSLPEPGTIVSEQSLPDNITRLTLSNGATVLLKPTTYDKDAISFIAWSKGGYTSLPVDRQTAASFAPSLMSAVGLGGMSATRLEEQTVSLNMGLQWSIGENGEVLAGKSSTKDLESFLRLVYLTSSEPGRDARAFNAARDRLSEQIVPYVKDPGYRFESSWSSNLFGGNPRAAALDGTELKALDFSETRALVIDSFADASEFTYILVGDFGLDTAKALVARHLGAIPAGTPDEPTWIEPLSPQGASRRVDYPISQERRASVRMVWAANSPWTWQREATLGLMAQALNNRLLDALREDLGGTYVVSTKAAFSKYPQEQYSFIVQFDTDPDRVDELIEQVRAEVASLIDGSFSEQYIKQVQTATQRDVTGRGRTNDFWVNRLGNALVSGLDFAIMERATETLVLADPTAFTTLASELLPAERLFVYVMLPE